jgi:hypothetical protein
MAKKLSLNLVSRLRSYIKSGFDIPFIVIANEVKQSQAVLELSRVFIKGVNNPDLVLDRVRLHRTCTFTLNLIKFEKLMQNALWVVRGK